MATANLIDSARFTWDGGSETFLLRVPLQKVRPAGRSRSYVSESLDYSVRNVINVGQVRERIGVIRYDDDPEGLLDFLLAGHRGEALTYTDSTGSFGCQLIEPSAEAFQADLEVDHNVFKESTIEIRIRIDDDDES